jgi:hypothetical protein
MTIATILQRFQFPPIWSDFTKRLRFKPFKDNQVMLKKDEDYFTAFS